MVVERMLERGSFKAGPASKCAGCPFAGLCSPCRPQTLQFGKKAEGWVVGRIEELLSSQELRPGIYYSSPARQVGGESPKTNEIICFICKEKTSTCRHSDSNTNALKAA